MAICTWCNQDMLMTDACTVKTVDYPDGKSLSSIPYYVDDLKPGAQEYNDRRCHDCNVKIGKFHHPGCDMEVCPRCRGQLISCGCLNSDDDDWDDDDFEDDGSDSEEGLSETFRW